MTKSKRPPRSRGGRPRTADPKTTRSIRMSSEEWRVIDAAAERADVATSAWVRDAALKAAKG